MLMQTWGQGFGIILKSLLVNFLFILRNFHQRNSTNCAELYINDQANIIDILEVRLSSVFTGFKSKNVNILRVTVTVHNFETEILFIYFSLYRSFI